MILVTVGTLAYPRLVRAMDEYAGAHPAEPVIIQKSSTAYAPRHAQSHDYLTDLNDLIREARVVVAHCGTGTVSTLLDLKKPFVLVPRRARHGEHFDDHQWEMAAVLRDRLPGVVVDDVSELEAAIEEAPKRRAQVEFVSTRPRLLAALRRKVDELLPPP